MPDALSADAQAIRELIEHFIAERSKNESVSNDEQHQLREQWLADAAHKSKRFKVATHILKGVHGSAKGTSLLCSPSTLPQSNAIGSHQLRETLELDATNDAAVLQIFSFLRQQYKHQSLLELLIENNPDVIAAFSDNQEQALAWKDAFIATMLPDPYSSHPYAKQVYWLTGDDPTQDDHYLLLAPLFPSSLVHAAYQQIQHDRFSEPAKEARQARRANKASAHEVHDYPELAFRKLGGTKPQNISQLNSERGGQNILLSSLPPQWDTSKISPILNAASALPQLRSYRHFSQPLYRLRAFLHRDPPAIKATRDTVKRLIDKAMEGVIQFTMMMHQLPPGWTAINNTLPDGSVQRCMLPANEQFWLDPFRSAQDEAFRQRRALSAWQDYLQETIAREINRELKRSEKLRNDIGDIELREWKRRANTNEQNQALLKIDGFYMDALARSLDRAVPLLDAEEAIG